MFEFEHISDIVDDFLPTAGYFFAAHGSSVVTPGTWNNRQTDKQFYLYYLENTGLSNMCIYIYIYTFLFKRQPSPHIKKPNMTKHFGTEFHIWWVGTNPLVGHSRFLLGHVLGRIWLDTSFGYKNV